MREPTPAPPGGLGSGPAEPPDLLGHLEQRVKHLVQRHGEARRIVEDLRAQLRERDGKITELYARLLELDKRRSEAAERLSSVIARVESLERESARS